jgi:hypothetical protein
MKEYRWFGMGIDEVSSEAGPPSLIYDKEVVHASRNLRGRRTIGSAVSGVRRLSPHRIRISAGALCNPRASRFAPEEGKLTAYIASHHCRQEYYLTVARVNPSTSVHEAFVVREGLSTAKSSKFKDSGGKILHHGLNHNEDYILACHLNRMIRCCTAICGTFVSLTVTWFCG